MNYRIRDDVPEDEDASRLLSQDVEMDTMMGSAQESEDVVLDEDGTSEQ
jgi:hypothetical protein